MAISRQFKALMKISGFFAGAWAVAGAAIGAFVGTGAVGGTIGSAVLRFALMYGLAGGIAGVTTAVLAARVERGRRVNDIPVWRLTAWGVLGGATPAAIFGFLALIADAPISGVVPLLGLGAIGGAVSGLIAGSAAAATKTRSLPERDDPAELTAG